MTDAVLVEHRAAVATVRLNRPEAMNSLDETTRVALLTALDELAADPSVRCVVLTGTGRAFCVGQDLGEHSERLASLSPAEIWAMVDTHYGRLARRLAGMDKPVVASLNGVAAGAGLSLAMACDLRLASDEARLTTAFAGIGLSCDTGSSWTLQGLVGAGRAADLLLRPRMVPADEALAIGLLTDVVPAAELPRATAELATDLADGPTVAYASIKQSLRFAATHDLEESLGFESRMMARTGGTRDHARAVDAFMAKRRPEFEGR